MSVIGREGGDLLLKGGDLLLQGAPLLQDESDMPLVQQDIVLSEKFKGIVLEIR